MQGVINISPYLFHVFQHIALKSTVIPVFRTQYITLILFTGIFEYLCSTNFEIFLFSEISSWCLTVLFTITKINVFILICMYLPNKYIYYYCYWRRRRKKKKEQREMQRGRNLSCLVVTSLGFFDPICSSECLHI